MSKELAIRNDGLPSEHEMDVYRTMAKGAITSGMYKGNEHGVIMIMLAARELGIPPMAALNGGIHLIQGKVEISARMMSALIRKAGHSLMVKESTDDICVVEGVRVDNGNRFTASYTLQDAQKAGLVRSGGGWTKFPKDMCFARAMSRLARQLFSDVIGIGYVEGEIQDKDPIEPMPVPPIPPAVLELQKNDVRLEVGSYASDQLLGKPIEPAKEEPKVVTDKMVSQLMELFEKVPGLREEVETFTLETMGVHSFKELTYDEFVKIGKDVRAKVNEAEKKKVEKPFTIAYATAKLEIQKEAEANRSEVADIQKDPGKALVLGEKIW